MKYIKFCIKEEIVTIIFNRPVKYNSFSKEFIEELTLIFSKAVSLKPRLIVFEASGKGFSGGFDFSNIEKKSDEELILRFIKIEQLLQKIYYSSIPTIAFVHGACYGAAADLLVTCQWRIASKDSKFLMPGSKFGVILGTNRLVNLVGENNARDIIFRDEIIKAPDALNFGLITQISEKENWEAIKCTIFDKLENYKNFAYKNVLKRMRKDERDSDLSELVNSITEGSIKQNIISYLKMKK